MLEKFLAEELLHPKPATYTVAFNSDGGTAIPLQRIKKGGKATKPNPDPVKTGYTFDEWQKGGVTYDFNTVVESNFVLTATYDINEYTVTFNSNGGSEVASQTVEYGGKVTEPADPTKADNTFVGWYKEEALTHEFDFENDTISADTILYAKWNVDPEPVWEHTVTFDSNGGSAVAPQDVLDGETATEPDPAPTKDGYTFHEWQLSGVAYNFSTPVTADITLVADWTAAQAEPQQPAEPEQPIGG